MFIRNGWDELTPQIFMCVNREADTILTSSQLLGEESEDSYGDGGAVGCVCVLVWVLVLRKTTKK